MQDTPLAAYADDPIYNMKAVTQRTGIPAATLRAWERRYHALAPRRSTGNYRLYSERDVAILRWLQAQLEAGLSISRAVALLERLRENDPEATLPAHPDVSEGGGKAAEAPAPAAASGVADWGRLAASLIGALLSLDEEQAGAVLAEAFALYSVEDVCASLITPVLTSIGEGWSEQRLSVAQEHFATSYLMARLLALFNATRTGNGPLALVCCAPGERHEVGALMLALLLRRAGHQVRYLGADVPTADIVKSVQQFNARVLAVSAAMPQALDRLNEVAQQLRETRARIHLVYGGRAFSLPEAQALHPRCDYVGTDLRQSVAMIGRLLLTEPPAGPS